MVEVSLSRGRKSRIRAPWSKTLIVKVFGRSVGFNYLTFKINAMWNPKGKMECVALGKDFFLIKFYDNEDYDKVLRGGKRKGGEHFLAIKPWEPYFKASEEKFTSIAVWVRLLELPIEFYDAPVLKEIGSALRLVLRIDSFMTTGFRGGDVIQTTPPENVKSVSMDLEKSTHTTVARGITVHPTVGMECGNEMEIWVPTLSSEKDKMAVSMSRQSKGHREKEAMGTKNTNAFKTFSHIAWNKTISSLKALEKPTKKENEPSSSNTTQLGQLQLGYLVQEQGHSNTQRDDCPNQSISHRHDGLVRFGSSSMGPDSQPMVAVPHRHPPDNGEGC
nr:hypothetical protein CFP56_06864 [Quercus suber]